MKTVDLAKENYWEISLKKVIALFHADFGAMGRPGEFRVYLNMDNEIVCYRGQKDIFDIAFLDDKGVSGEVQDLSVLFNHHGGKSSNGGHNKIGFYLDLRERLGLDSGAWNDFYLGMGNYLYLRKEIVPAFEKATDGLLPGQIYRNLSMILSAVYLGWNSEL